MDTKLVGTILRMIDRDLMGKIAPVVADEGLRIQVDYMSRLLQWAATHVAAFDRLAAVRAESLETIADRFERQSAAAGGGGPEEGDALAPLDGASATLRKLAAQSAHFPEFYADYVAAEQSFVRGMDAQQGSDFSAIYRGGRVAAKAADGVAPIDAASLTRYLRHRHPEHGEATVKDVRRLPGGFGKDTILFTVDACGAIDGKVVMRKDFAISASPGPVTEEFGLLRSLHALGLPVAQPLWAEDDRSIFGGAFIVSRKAAGGNDISGWAHDPVARRHCVDRLAAILASIHAIGPAALGRADAVPVDAREAMRLNMLRYYHHYRARAKAPVDRIETAFAWLLGNLPTTAGAPTRLLHGDVGFQNLLTRDGEIEAVLDWEFSGFGDPAADIGYAWQFIAELTSWDEFGAMYERHGGTMPAVATADYFRIWGDVRNACVGVGASGVVDLTPDADLRSPAAGLGFGPLCEIQALAGILAFERAHRIPAAVVDS